VIETRIFHGISDSCKIELLIGKRMVDFQSFWNCSRKARDLIRIRLLAGYCSRYKGIARPTTIMPEEE
jgi:hypothetical protein